MATITTKNKFGVPLEDSAVSGTGIIMPKLKYRFRVNFIGSFGGASRSVELTQNVQSVQRPSITVDEVEVHSYNSKVYLQGKHTWNTIDVTIRDDIQNSVAKLVGKQVQRQVNHYQQTAPAAANDFKFDLQVEVLDGINTGSTETWYCEGCFLQNVQYGDSDYSTNEPQLITLTIRFDNALHLAGENDVNGRASTEAPMPETGPGLFNNISA